MTPEDFHHALLADFETGKLYWKNPSKYHSEKLGLEAGFINIGKGKNKNYWQVRVFGKTFKRSRVIFFMAHGRWPMPAVDHANGNSLDDRLCNLRECDYSQNTANSKDKTRRNGLPRCVRSKPSGRYDATLRANGKVIYVGTFDTPEEAHDAYLRAKKEAFGDFA